MPRKPTDKPLTAKDQHDWAQAVEEVEPYSAPAEKPALPPEAPPSVEPEQRPSISIKPIPTSKRSDFPDLTVGQLHDMDKRTADRLRRGKIAVDAVLDLHGKRQVEAAEAFYAFLQARHAAGARCVLVITGQGKRSGEGPVLQQALQRWVNEPLLRPSIVAYDYATPAQGGKGAFLLYLRRSRAYD